MQQYKDLVKDVLENGIDSDDRTGTGTKSVFGRQIRFDLQKGFPLVTLKKTYWKGVVIELLWMLSGSSNISFLQKHDVHIWDEWANGDGDLGPVYGAQWRSWAEVDYHEVTNHIDQLYELIKNIKYNPNSRRHILTAWNVGQIGNMALPPCHMMCQFYVRNGKLSCQLYQRSADLFLGVPFNIASYALLTHLIAAECGLEVGEFIHTFGDAHIYNNHIDQVKEMLKREPKELPQLEIEAEAGLFALSDQEILDSLSWEDIQEAIQLKNYNPHPTIKGKVSV